MILALFLLLPQAVELQVTIGTCTFHDAFESSEILGRVDARAEASNLVVQLARPGVPVVERTLPDPHTCIERARAVRLVARAWMLELQSPLVELAPPPLEGPRHPLRAPLPEGLEYTASARPPGFEPAPSVTTEAPPKAQGPLWAVVGVGLAAIASGAVLQFGPEDAAKAGKLFLPISLYAFGGAVMTVGLFHDAMP